MQEASAGEYLRHTVTKFELRDITMQKTGLASMLQNQGQYVFVDVGIFVLTGDLALDSSPYLAEALGDRQTRAVTKRQISNQYGFRSIA